MAIKQTFQYTSIDEGADLLSFTDWANTLTDIEKNEVQLAIASLTKIERALVKAGKLTIEFLPAKTYTWSDEAAADIGVPESSDWEKYHKRYLEENNTTLEIITETV